MPRAKKDPRPVVPESLAASGAEALVSDFQGDENIAFGDTGVSYEIKQKTQPTRTIQVGGEWQTEETVLYNGIVFGVRITNGLGETGSRAIAIDLLDMGYQVKPNPRFNKDELALLSELEERYRAEPEKFMKHYKLLMSELRMS